MDTKFISERISILRTKKNISEYRMSTDLGHSKSYIQSISSGRSMPSMNEFLYICEYLGVTPLEFFDEGNDDPEALKEFIEEGKKLSPEAMQHILHLMKELNSKK